MDSKLKNFIENNSDRYEIFHEGYRKGVIDGFTTAIKRDCAVLEVMKEIQEK